MGSNGSVSALGGLLAATALALLPAPRVTAAETDSGGARDGGALIMASCVEGSPPLVFARADPRALLDSEDRQRFQGAALTLYRVLDRSAFASVQIMLWDKGPGEWVYVSVLPVDGDTQRSCFTATFTAEPFEFTPALIRKYFPGAGRT
jgi:hypothetical protein